MFLISQFFGSEVQVGSVVSLLQSHKAKIKVSASLNPYLETLEKVFLQGSFRMLGVFSFMLL